MNTNVDEKEKENEKRAPWRRSKGEGTDVTEKVAQF